MIITLSPSPYSIRSFIILLYDPDKQEIGSYQVPIAVAAPFANRLFRELLPQQHMQEPWYTLSPYTINDKPLDRALHPFGPTSLYGQQYDPATQPHPPIKLHPDAPVRYFVIKLYDVQEEKYTGAYSVDDIFLHGASYLLHHGPLKGKTNLSPTPYYYEVIPNTKAINQIPADWLPEKMYETEGIFSLPVRAKDEPRIKFSKIQAPILPEKPLAAFPPVTRYGQGEQQMGQVIVPRHIYRQWRRRLQLSHINEEGGYIVGNVYRQPGSDPREEDTSFRWIVEVTDILMAQEAVGTPVSLLFTHDTWSLARRQRGREHPQRELVGWWHTHPFPATDTFGLSGWDQDKHAQFFTRPYQIAILLNIESQNPRTVRCYQRNPDGILVETPYAVISTTSPHKP